MAKAPTSHRRPRPLPGARTAAPAGSRPYVVNLRIEESPRRGRAAVARAHEHAASRFVARLQAELDRRGLGRQLHAVADAGPLPVVTLTCTPEVARLIASMPEVLDVYPDDQPALELVR